MFFPTTGNICTFTEVRYLRNALAANEKRSTEHMNRVHRELAQLNRRFVTEDANRTSDLPWAHAWDRQSLDETVAKIGQRLENIEMLQASSDMQSLKDMAKIEQRLANIEMLQATSNKHSFKKMANIEQRLATIGMLQATSNIESLHEKVSKIEQRLANIDTLQAPQHASDHDFVDLSRTPDCVPP